MIHHPSEILPKECAAMLTATAAEAEDLRDLHPVQLRLIYEQGWFKMFVPREAGGLGFSLPEALRLEEALSWADGSTAWVVTLCGGAGWFTGFLQPSLLRPILSGERVCFAGSGAATGRANITDDGYEITGKWKYASGSLHATVFTANCYLYQDGLPMSDADGTPLVGTFWFYRDEVQLLHQWNTMGMIATASHSFEVRGVRIPENRRFVIDAKHATLNDPVYQYPFLQLAETTLSVNLSGMACRFLDLAANVFEEGNHHATQRAKEARARIENARGELHRYRQDFYTVVNASWEECAHERNIAHPLLDQVSSTSHALARKSLRLVDEIYPWCGLAAAVPGEEINRVWRNLHTASQHTLFSMM